MSRMRPLDRGETSVMKTCQGLPSGEKKPEWAVQSLNRPRNERGGVREWECPGGMKPLAIEDIEMRFRSRLGESKAKQVKARQSKAEARAEVEAKRREEQQSKEEKMKQSPKAQNSQER